MQQTATRHPPVEAAAGDGKGSGPWLSMPRLWLIVVLGVTVGELMLRMALLGGLAASRSGRTGGVCPGDYRPQLTAAP